jgi:hypothetical protein
MPRPANVDLQEVDPIEAQRPTVHRPHSHTIRRLYARTLRGLLHRRLVRRALLAAGALALLPSATASAAAAPGMVSALAPAPASAYHARHVCSAPAPGHASCLALELAPGTGIAPLRARSPLGRALAGRGAQPSQTRAGAGFAVGQTPEPVSPAELRSAYRLPAAPLQGSAVQTIALVDAYNDLGAEADLAVYDHAPSIKLSECTRASGCFSKVNQNGENATEGASGNPFPKSAKELKERETTCKTGKEKGPREAACAEVEEAAGWTVEISTDIDVAHSLCQSCHILLVEANSSAYEDLETAEDTAVRLGATEVSNSWGGPEPPLDSPAFDHPQTVITAAAGDNGYLEWTKAEEATANSEEYYVGADYPASSPHVVAVGGTELTLSEAGERKSETVWNEDPDPEGKNQGAGGAGCSLQFAAPEWQQDVPDWASVGCGTGAAESKRAVADVAADADPYSGVLVYDSGESKEDLLVIGGTSVASPIIASVFALAGGAHEVKYPAQTLYSHLGSPSLYDVTEGGAGQCDDLYTSGCSGSMEPLSSRFPFDCGAGVLICNAASSYDGPTGVGTPNGIAAFEPASEEANAKRAEEERKAEEAKREAEKKQTEAELKASEEKRAAAEKQAAEEREAEEQRKAVEKLKEEEANGGVGKQANQGGPAGANSGIGATTAGAGTSKTSPNGSAGANSSGSPGAGSGAAGQSAARLSGLTLTARASSVIARGLPTLSQVAFAFTLSAPARVRITLSRQVRLHGHLHWRSAPGAFTLAAAMGRDRLHLHGQNTLAPGRYRLTLTLARGGARSIVFVLR